MSAPYTRGVAIPCSLCSGTSVPEMHDRGCPALDEEFGL